MAGWGKTVHLRPPDIRTLPLTAAALLIALLTACGPRTPTDNADAPQIVDVATARPAADTLHVSATGALRRQRQITLSFRNAGTISKLTVDDGYPVKKGQLIAELDPIAIRARLTQAEAGLAKAKRDLARGAKLIGALAMTQADYDNLKTSEETAQAAYDSARFDMEGALIISPVGGSVLTRSAQVGEVVQASQPVVSVADDASPLLLRVPLPDRDAVKLREGSLAHVTLQGMGTGPLTGRVSHIGAQAGPQSGAVDVDIAIPPAPALRSGTVGTAVLTLDETATAPGAQRIPDEALLEANGSLAHVLVFDAKAGVARRADVRFLRFDGDDAVVDGLAPGAQVVTAGAGYISPGQKIAILSAGKD